MPRTSRRKTLYTVFFAIFFSPIFFFAISAAFLCVLCG